MPEFYSDADVRNHFSAPQMTNNRHRYRGPRETEKINLEIDQIAFSIRRLYERYDQISKDFVVDAQLLIEGGVLTIEDESGPITIDGLDVLASKIEDLKKRIKVLEE